MSQPYMTFNGVTPQYMPAQPLATSVEEESAFILNVGFFDENGSATLGSGITWSLSYDDGTIVNGRKNVAYAGSGSTIMIVLDDDDTEREDLDSSGFQDDLVRIVSVKAYYNSPIAGEPLLMAGIFKFLIVPQPPIKDKEPSD